MYAFLYMKWFLLLSIVILSSCRVQRRIYSPLPVNNPSLQEKNDFSVNASISTPKGFDINGGFAVTNRLAIIAGAYTHKNKDVEYNNDFTNQYDSSNLVYRHNGFTLGTGVYFPLTGPGSDNYLSFFGGISKGSFKMNEAFYQVSPNPSTSLNNYKSTLNRYFLQGSMNFYGEIIEGSVTTRYNLVEHKNVITDYTNTQLEDFQLPPFVTGRFNSFVDFSFDIKTFFSRNPRWGIQVFAVVSTRTNKDDDPDSDKRFYHYYPFRAGTGIFFRGFSRKNKGK